MPESHAGVIHSAGDVLGGHEGRECARHETPSVRPIPEFTFSYITSNLHEDEPAS